MRTPVRFKRLLRSGTSVLPAYGRVFTPLCDEVSNLQATREIEAQRSTNLHGGHLGHRYCSRAGFLCGVFGEVCLSGR